MAVYHHQSQPWELARKHHTWVIRAPCPSPPNREGGPSHCGGGLWLEEQVQDLCPLSFGIVLHAPTNIPRRRTFWKFSPLLEKKHETHVQHITILAIWGKGYETGMYEVMSSYRMFRPARASRKRRHWGHQCLQKDGAHPGSDLKFFWGGDKRMGNIHWLVVSTNLKNISKMGNLPQEGLKVINIWNHQPESPWNQHNPPLVGRRSDPFQRKTRPIFRGEPVVSREARPRSILCCRPACPQK